jgi:hypothetical protein
MGWWDRWFGWARRAPLDVEDEPEEAPAPPQAPASPAAAAPPRKEAPAPRRAEPSPQPPAPAAAAPAARPPKPAKPKKERAAAKAPAPKKAREVPATAARKERVTGLVPRPSARAEVLSVAEAERRYGELVREPEPPPVEVAPEAEPVQPVEVVPAAPAVDRPEDRARREAAAESRRAAAVPRYEALLARADALLAVPGAELRHLRIARDELTEGWRRVGPAPAAEAEALQARRDACLARFQERIGVAEAALREISDRNLAERQAVVDEAKALAERADLRGAGPAMGELRSKLRACGPVRDEDHAMITAAFAEAEKRLRERQEQVRTDRDQARAEQIGRLEALVRAAESLATSREPPAAAERVKQLQAEWKTVRVPGERTEVDALWARFRAACDAVFARRAAFWAEASQVAINRLEAVVVEAETLAEDGCDPDEVIPRLMAAWKKAGRAPREEQDARWERLQAAFGRMRAPQAIYDLGDSGPAWRPFEALLKGREG